MKRVLLILGGIILFLLLALAIAPFLLKDKIKAKIDAEIASTINGKVYYDAESLSLSFFRHFPNLSVSLERFGVINAAPFEGDTLADIGRFSATVNIASLISGDKIKVVSIELDKPRINALRLPDGTANWDIVKQDTTQKDTTTQEPTQFSVGIERWAITDGTVFFADGQAPMTLAIQGLNHSGSGDFTQDIFDLSTETEAQSVSFEMDSVSYLSNKRVRAKLSAEINQPEAKYTLRDNEFYINDLGLGLNGWVQMKDPAINTDISFKSLNGNFKDILSLVPGIYTKSFEGLKADGSFSLEGLVKGIYQDSLLPKLVLDVKVDQGQFQYPDLPSAVTGVGLDLHIDHAQGPLESIAVELKKFEMKMGKNPVSAHASVRGISNMLVDGAIKAKLNLTEISNAFPMDGLTLKGLLSVDATAKGTYNSAKNRLPAVTAALNLVDGYVKSAQFPEPIEALTVQAFVDNATGRMEDTKIRIPSLSLRLEGQPFTASALIEDLVNYRWDIAAKGTLDLAKITRIYPIEGTQLAGLLKADIQTRGAMADVTAGRYDRLPTSGTLDLAGLVYKSTSVPQGVTAKTVAVRFTPTQIQLTNFDGAAGKSALHLDGNLSNYFGYVLKGQTIKGNLNVSSPDFNVNEWMATGPEPKTAEAETPMKAIEVPRNIDFVLASDFSRLRYSNIDMTDVKGQIVVRDGVVNLNGLRMNAFAGTVKLDGTYDSRNLGRPSYAMTFDMKDVAASELYNSFNTVRTLAPIAKSIGGRLTTTMKLNGELNGKMEPVFPSLQGGGKVIINDAQLSNLTMIDKLNSVAKLNLPTSSNVKNLTAIGEIVNGRLNFKPFDVNIGGQKLTLGGSNGFDQTIDWTLTTLLPPSAVGKAASAIPALSSFTGGNQAVPLNFNVSGTQASPKVSFVGLGKGATDAVKDRAKAEADKLKQEAQQRAQAEADRLKKEAEDRAKAEADRLKQQAADKAKDELNKLKNKFGFPK